MNTANNLSGVKYKGVQLELLTHQELLNAMILISCKEIRKSNKVLRIDESYEESLGEVVQKARLGYFKPVPTTAGNRFKAKEPADG